MKNFKYYRTFTILIASSALSLVACGGSTQSQNEESQIQSEEKISEEQPCTHFVLDFGENILFRECDGFGISGFFKAGNFNYNISDNLSEKDIVSGNTDEYNVYDVYNHEEILKLEEQMIKEGKIKVYKKN